MFLAIPTNILHTGISQYWNGWPSTGRHPPQYVTQAKSASYCQWVMDNAQCCSTSASKGRFTSVIQANTYWPALAAKKWRFCWNKVLLPSFPCSNRTWWIQIQINRRCVQWFIVSGSSLKHSWDHTVLDVLAIHMFNLYRYLELTLL